MKHKPNCKNFGYPYLNLINFFLDIFSLENELPEELLGGGDPQGTVSNGPCPTAVNIQKPIVQSQLQSPFSSTGGGGNNIPVPSQLISQTPRPPSVQSHKQITQLLQSDRNSPKYSTNAPSPGSAAIGSPHPSRQATQPQPSPASNSMQSPNAGNIIANIKSPVSVTAGPVSRTPGSMRTTPSPRVLSSSINSPLVHTSLQSSIAFTRNMPNTPLMSGIVQQHITSNGPVQPQLQILQQNLSQSAGIPSNLNNVGGMQGGFVRNVNPSSMVIFLWIFL